jgi:hypothetical protein
METQAVRAAGLDLEASLVVLVSEKVVSLGPHENWGMRDMKKLALLTVSVLFLGMTLTAQDRATMSAPVIRAVPEGNVTISAQFADMSANGEYRVGFAIPTGKVPGIKLELLKDGTPVNLPVMDFEQGYCANWWGISKVSAQGFVVLGSAIPGKDQKLTLRVTAPKTELDKYKKAYLLVSRKYGTDVWYIEDGSEMDESYW